ncbi:hypothetical protein HOC80_02245 [archaeon]|jgi:hypothetical protein|nr:hypothetical protein [archaeon]MBT4416900.1 hypothetical protein [archaeon]
MVNLDIFVSMFNEKYSSNYGLVREVKDMIEEHGKPHYLCDIGDRVCQDRDLCKKIKVNHTQLAPKGRLRMFYYLLARANLDYEVF